MLLSGVPPYYKARRDALMKAHPNAIFIFPSGAEVLRNPDVHFPFRQESNFYYLSGFEEPDSFLVLAGGKSILFVRDRNPETEMWEGQRYGVEGAKQVFGVDEAFTIGDLPKKLAPLFESAQSVYYRMGHVEHMDRQIVGALETARTGLGRSGKTMPPLVDPSGPLGEMRLFKSAEEIKMISEACRISAGAYVEAMKAVRPGMNEYEVEALIDYVFRKDGCQRVGYGSIVAGGKNASCLHYRFNNEKLKDGDLLLIDAGGEYGYYTADITRTFPVGKRFSPTQAALYDLVLKAQKEAIAAVRPGAKIPEIHKQVCLTLVEGLLKLGILKGADAEQIVKDGGHRRFYPHGTSHWLGMDVHDVGLYVKDGNPRVLEPGMILTVEPGFYIQPTDQDVPEKYRGAIGIRIEDDILVTQKGCEVLTRAAPKERAEIEELRQAQG